VAAIAASAAAAVPAAAGDGKPPKLRLDVKPRTVETGRQTSFAFRVTRPDGRAVKGATVRFAGSEARTGPKGRARIEARFGKPGKRTARATKQGFRSGSRSVVVRRPAPVSFSGDCELTGTVTFDPPMTNTPQTIEQHARAPGTCTGTFTDGRGREHELDGAPVVFDERGRGDNVSCASGTPTGTGFLEFELGRLDFEMAESRAGALALLNLTGQKSGSAAAFGTPPPGGDPSALLAKCSGPGIERVELTGRLTTPGISG
jgi:hypothetical protein